MFPFLRLGRVLAVAAARARLEPLGTSVVPFRVLPGDLDQNRHMNNGRYLTMMDLGRFDLVMRTGLMRVLVENRWYPVVTAATFRYRRSLDAFQRYELHTRLLAWDERGFYIEQRFVRDGHVHGLGVIKGVFLGRDGKVPPREITERIAPGVASPPLPAWVELWDKSQEALAQELRGAPGGPAG